MLHGVDLARELDVDLGGELRLARIERQRERRARLSGNGAIFQPSIVCSVRSAIAASCTAA
jgi:hypothetical protein